MALILDDDGFLDAADGFAGWDDALVDDTLAQELEQERTAELESELEQDERPIDYDAELEDAEEEAAPTSEKALWVRPLTWLLHFSRLLSSFDERGRVRHQQELEREPQRPSLPPMHRSEEAYRRYPVRVSSLASPDT